MIKIYDNKVPFHIMHDIHEFVINSRFYITGWKDKDYVNKHSIYSDWSIDDLKNAGLYSYLEEIPSVDFSKWYKTMVNLSHPSDHYYTHTHGENDYVLLYYVNLEWRDEWHGETLFYDPLNLQKIEFASSFIPGRILQFDGIQPHSIRPQSSVGPQYRFTISNFFKKK
tara:strand:+ start:8644 stop:9147 length:504 start_codon:yes stop_codon:yes gene_type:complete